LLSVAKLTEDFDCYFTFDANGFKIKDMTTGRILGTGSRRGSLYAVDDTKRLEAFFSNRSHAASEEVWHRRLGHPNARVLQHLKNKGTIDVSKSSIIPCSSCPISKSTKLPFVCSASRSFGVLDKIHCDLWGPSPIPSVQGFNYYVIFVDDCSRFTWLYPLKKKSDFFSCFQKFHVLVENQLDKKIKVFQSDGGGEFKSQELVRHMANAGITHQMSCPHTPEQNGVAERKHRHITELGRAMLYGAHVPTKFWVEAFTTA